MAAPYRVVLIGPESTGKTTLARELAAATGGLWVPEAARLVAERATTGLSAATVEPIARLALALDDGARASSAPTLVYDTDLVSTVVYAHHYYGTCPDWILAEARARRADRYLLCVPDLPWHADGIRDRPGARTTLFRAFFEAVDAIGARPALVSGTGAGRLAAARAGLAAGRALTRRPY